jgi:cephalosporin-C deacetylase-like acetyl esterase
VVKEFGILTTADGFRVEKLAFQSLPNFWVTANLYMPAGTGPFPAVLLAPGHEATGKQSQYSFGGNFARNGIMALAIDPLGQGERLQYFDPEKKTSTIGGSTGEHGEANVPAMLIGEDVARYFINDSMRAIDYLISRKDVNPDRIGALGCSGGGTSTAYLAALDDRVKVAGVACYITSFQELLPSATGVQEAEQSIPHFIEQGLDFGDYVEAFAPKPYAIISTMSDMFPFEGARQTHDEAARFYKLYGAEDKLQWITGPGGHGNLGPISPTILGFFVHNLAGGPAGDATFAPLRIANAADLLVTPTGQVSTSLGGETVASIVKSHAPAPAKPHDVRREIHTLAAVPSTRPKLVSDVSFGRLTILTFQDGVSISADVAGHSGRKPTVLLLGSHSDDDVNRLIASGSVVMSMEPRPSPPGTEGSKSPYLGSFNLISLRAFLVGQTIMGMRIDDTIRAVDYLSTQNVDSITLYGSGAMGAVALHAAALDSRIGRVVIENTLTSYRMVLDQPLHRNISEIMIPGVLRKYDMGDLLAAIAPRQITVINPQDATGAVITADQFRKELGISSNSKIRVTTRAASDPIPID